ncbi:hypothetical protein D3C84_972030 [compost metagenome]
MSKLTVIRQNEQTFRIIIQSTDWIYTFSNAWQEVRNDLTPLWICRTCNNTFRFIQNDIDLLLLTDCSSIDPNLIFSCIHFHTQRRDDFTVHLHASRCNDFFTFPAGCDPSFG